MFSLRHIGILILVIAPIFNSVAQHKRTVVKNVTKHENGQTKKDAKITTIYSKNPDILDFYWKKIYEVVRYDSTGKKVYELERITKRGTYGKSCFEILYRYVQYDSEGNKSWEQESKCDCKHQTQKTYKNGKLITRERKRRFSWN